MHSAIAALIAIAAWLVRQPSGIWNLPVQVRDYVLQRNVGEGAASEEATRSGGSESPYACVAVRQVYAVLVSRWPYVHGEFFLTFGLQDMSRALRDMGFEQEAGPKMSNRNSTERQLQNLTPPNADMYQTKENASRGSLNWDPGSHAGRKKPGTAQEQMGQAVLALSGGWLLGEQVLNCLGKLPELKQTPFVPSS